MKTIIIVLIALYMSACSQKLVRVMPYEKEYFAQEKMSLSPIAEQSEQEGHVFLIREASAGGNSSFQGGCGCR